MAWTALAEGGMGHGPLQAGMPRVKRPCVCLYNRFVALQQ